jgi:hypothetical protein
MTLTRRSLTTTHQVSIIPNYSAHVNRFPISIRLKNNISFETIDLISPTAQSRMDLKKCYFNKINFEENNYINNENIDIDEDIPNEKSIHYNKVLKIPNSPLRLYKGKVKSRHSRERRSTLEDDSQKTLKSSFNPVMVKNYKNYFKYKSNLVDEEASNLDITPEIIENITPKSRNKTNNNSIVKLEQVVPTKPMNIFEKMILYFKNLGK